MYKIWNQILMYWSTIIFFFKYNPFFLLYLVNQLFLWIFTNQRTRLFQVTNVQREANHWYTQPQAYATLILQYLTTAIVELHMKCKGQLTQNEISNHPRQGRKCFRKRPHVEICLIRFSKQTKATCFWSNSTGFVVRVRRRWFERQLLQRNVKTTHLNMLLSVSECTLESPHLVYRRWADCKCHE